MSSNNKTLINPFKLLGVNYNSSNTELKKAYYHLALLCHPDKGGCKDDMDIISKAYHYAREQINNKTDKTYEELQDEFDEFCKAQLDKKPDTFAYIYEETNDWIVDFNKEFELQRKTSLDNDEENNPYSLQNGYGNLMKQSDTNINKLLENGCEYNSKINDKEKVINFSSEIIEYKEPTTLNNFNDYGFPLDKKNVKTFTNNKNIDYKQAFSEPEKIEFNTEKYDYDILEEFEKLRSNYEN
jgi:curved DNA-binding protein CbpA